MKPIKTERLLDELHSLKEQIHKHDSGVHEELQSLKDQIRKHDSEAFWAGLYRFIFLAFLILATYAASTQ